MMFCTVEEAKQHTYIDFDSDDNLIQIYIEAASFRIDQFCQGNVGIVTEDGFEVFDHVKVATMIYVALLYRDRDNSDPKSWNQHTLPAPIKSMLLNQRTPVVI